MDLDSYSYALRTKMLLFCVIISALYSIIFSLEISRRGNKKSMVIHYTNHQSILTNYCILNICVKIVQKLQMDVVLAADVRIFCRTGKRTNRVTHI